MNALADTSKDKSESSDKREEIVGKLNEALGALRRERDELHRSKELSNERLCLIREERQALEKTVQAMRLTLKDLTEKAALSEENDDTETELQAEVDRLTKEMKFQRAELNSKKEKLSQITKSSSDNAKSFHASLSLAQKEILKYREKLSWLERKQEEEIRQEFVNKEGYDCDQTHAQPDQNRIIDENVKQLVSAMKETKFRINMDEEWTLKWPRLVEKKANAIMRQAEDIERSNDRLRKLLDCNEQYNIANKKQCVETKSPGADTTS